ncbi:MAG: cytochrome b [Sphingomonadales bacterium]|nr:cytochrome b [Sphingomonadales bacterium]MBD3772640.1 cytochrome b [Paracoccaceae bacterium]
MSAAAIRYNRGARLLHWLIAALVIANLASGLLHDPLEDYVRLMPSHKAIGMSVLALSLARLAWRFTWRAPAYPEAMTAFERGSAKAVHALFYLLMLAMPLTGWIVSSASKYPLDWFGLFDIPKLAVTKGSATYGFGHEAHELLGYLFLALVVLHVAAALRHHFVLRDDILRRMA